MYCCTEINTPAVTAAQVTVNSSRMVRLNGERDFPGSDFPYLVKAQRCKPAAGQLSWHTHAAPLTCSCLVRQDITPANEVKILQRTRPKYKCIQQQIPVTILYYSLSVYLALQ